MHQTTSYHSPPSFFIALKQPNAGDYVFLPNTWRKKIHNTDEIWRTSVLRLICNKNTRKFHTSNNVQILRVLILPIYSFIMLAIYIYIYSHAGFLASHLYISFRRFSFYVIIILIFTFFVKIFFQFCILSPVSLPLKSVLVSI